MPMLRAANQFQRTSTSMRNGSAKRELRDARQTPHQQERRATVIHNNGRQVPANCLGNFIQTFHLPAKEQWIVVIRVDERHVLGRYRRRHHRHRARHQTQARPLLPHLVEPRVTRRAAAAFSGSAKTPPWCPPQPHRVPRMVLMRRNHSSGHVSTTGQRHAYPDPDRPTTVAPTSRVQSSAPVIHAIGPDHHAGVEAMHTLLAILGVNRARPSGASANMDG